jgi:hypothetical protein
MAEGYRTARRRHAERRARRSRVRTAVLAGVAVGAAVAAWSGGGPSAPPPDIALSAVRATVPATPASVVRAETADTAGGASAAPGTTTTTAKPPGTTGAPATTKATTTAPPSEPAATTAKADPAGFPSAAGTGVPAGVKLTVTGDLTVTTPGAVIDAKDIHGCLSIRADRVTVKRSRIRCAGDYVVRTADDVTGVVLQDVEIDGTGSAATIAIGVTGYTLRRADVHGVGDGPRMGDNTVVEDSWIHGLVEGGGSHNDGIQSTGGHHLVIRGNRIENPKRQTSCILIGADLGDISDVLVTGNLLNGGNYTVYAGADPGHTASNIRVTGNRFGRDAVYGPASVKPGIVWEDNVWHDNGKPVPRS